MRRDPSHHVCSPVVHTSKLGNSTEPFGCDQMAGHEPRLKERPRTTDVDFFVWPQRAASGVAARTRIHARARGKRARPTLRLIRGRRRSLGRRISSPCRSTRRFHT
jgi:hypothetical protein